MTGNNNCECAESGTQGQQGQDGKQATPFNLYPFEVLLVYCVVIALTSSLYYNWPAVERILVDAGVFGNLCTREEIHAAVEGMFVCDRQRREIGNLALYIFYSEFVAFSIGGLLADLVGVYLVLILGFIFGFLSFIFLYGSYLDNPMIKLAFCFWGMFGGFVFITSIHFPKMFPNAKSLADGMIIFFDNMSGLMPLIMYGIMKKFKLKYNEAFGSYLIWGLFPAFALTLLFIPVKIINQNNSSSGGAGGSGSSSSSNDKNWPINYEDLKNLGTQLQEHKLWTNLCVYSISLTCSIFYKKMFSTYFLRNQKLVRLFPIFLLFVFLPTPFISVLNQFMGVHITSSLLYVLAIFAFICCLYPTRQYGFLSMVLFTISTSAAEQQTMSYISENNQKNEATLLGISYSVDLIIGLTLQRIFHLIYYKCSPRMTVYFIVLLFMILIGYSVYCHIQSCSNNESQTQSPSGPNSKTSRWRILYILLWFVPFLILSLKLSVKFNHKTKPSGDITELIQENCSKKKYCEQKKVTMFIIFYSFSLFYVYEAFFIVFSIYKVASSVWIIESRLGCFLCFIFCFFIVPQFLILLNYFNDKRHMKISGLMLILFLFKMLMFVFYRKGIYNQWSAILFCGFLSSYGSLLFVLMYMLSYYNFLIGFVEKLHKSSLIHWSTVGSAFIAFRFIQDVLSTYRYHYYIMFGLSCFLFILFTVVIYLYLPYEMNIPPSLLSFNLPIPNFKCFNKECFTKHEFYGRMVLVALSVSNFAVVINMPVRLYYTLILLLLMSHVLIHLSNLVYILQFSQSSITSISKYIPISPCLSLFLFLLLFIIRIFVGHNRFNTSKIIGFIIFVNFVVLCLSSNLIFMDIQKQLQCCCTKQEQSCSETCCSDNPCSCCTLSGQTCQRCCQEQGSCSCANDRTNCNSCCCKCLKKVLGSTNSNQGFCFYIKDVCKVNKFYHSFILGTMLGWSMFIAYLNVSRGRIEECLFQ